MLIDEQGHEADVLERVRAAAGLAYGDAADDLMDELSEMLSVPDLRAYVSRGFFRDHLAMYTKSRRKAPIYWPLTVPSKTGESGSMRRC